MPECMVPPGAGITPENKEIFQTHFAELFSGIFLRDENEASLRANLLGGLETPMIPGLHASAMDCIATARQLDSQVGQGYAVPGTLPERVRETKRAMQDLFHDTVIPVAKQRACRTPHQRWKGLREDYGYDLGNVLRAYVYSGLEVNENMVKELAYLHDFNEGWLRAMIMPHKTVVQKTFGVKEKSLQLKYRNHGYAVLTELKLMHPRSKQIRYWPDFSQD